MRWDLIGLSATVLAIFLLWGYLDGWDHYIKLGFHKLKLGALIGIVRGMDVVMRLVGREWNDEKGRYE